MFQNRRNLVVLAGAAGLNLLLGVAVASGVVPQPGDSVSIAAQHPAVTTPVEAAPEGPATEPEEPPTTPPDTAAPVTSAPTTAPPTTRARAATPAPAPEPEPAPPSTAASEPAEPLTTAVPRRNPTSFEVFQAIQQLSARIPMFRPTEAQARQFGDTVCTAFDQGNSYSQVKAGVLAAVGQVPLLTVSSADADFAIRTAVELFCPGHKSKLA